MQCRGPSANPLMKFRLVRYAYIKIGNKPELQTAFERLQEYLRKTSSLEFAFQVVDCMENPEMAVEAGVLATPTVLKKSPLPSVKVIGNIEDSPKTAHLLGF